MSKALMVGREAELAIVQGAIDAVDSGERRLLVIRGEAGIGKTRLLDALQESTASSGHPVLRGHATELESDQPFAAVLEAFGWHRWELPLDPEVVLSPANRWQLYRSVTERLDALAGAAPVVLILDDVHWADPVTLEFLEHTIRRPPRKASLLVVALRPGPIADRLLDAQRVTGGGGAVIDLVPLGMDAADRLMPESLGPQDRERIFFESGGNPMFIEELARSGSREAIPGGVSAYVRVEIARTPRISLALLQSGAILGDPFDVTIAGLVAGLEPAEITFAIDDLVERSFLRTTQQLSQMAFRHPVVRTAVYAAMPAGSRLAGHARAGEVLARLGAPLPAQARQLAHGAVPGDATAAMVLRAAATLVHQQAPGIAADWLLAAQNADPTADLDVLAVLAETLVDAGRLLEALTVADQGLAIVDGSAVVSAADSLRLVLVAASVERLIGRYAAAQRRLTHALAQQDPHGPSAARLMANLALSAYESGSFGEFVPWAERARAIDSSDRLVQAAAAALLAVGHTFAGRAESAASESALAIAALADATDQELAAHAELLTAVSWSMIAIEQLPDALSTGRRTSAAAGRAGNSSAAVGQELAVVLALGLLGRIRPCVDAADRAEQSARMTGNNQIVQWAMWMRAWAVLERGNVQTALIVAAESVTLATRFDDSWQGPVSRAVYGAALVAAGEPAKGRPLLAAYDLDPGWVCRWAPVLVEADLALGDLTAAREHADRASALAGEIGLAGPRSAAARTQAVLALAVDRPDQAHVLALAAIADAEQVGAALEIARSQLMAGRALGKIDRKAAISHLELARGQADVCGAQRVHDEAVRELRKLGRRVGRGGARASGDGELGVLSPRELEIAELVARGHTNREIGAQLFLSEKTVESHLSRTFAKLDVRSRAALAARLGAAR